MKKFIALILLLTFVFTLSACNSQNTVSDTDASTPVSSETLVKPENYASVLLVSINTQFKLYLDENNKVLAVEPINDDAESFSKSIDFENKTVEAVVGSIVEKANEKGFIKENVTVDFEITEHKEDVDNSDILTKAVSAVNKKATELKIEIKTEIKESGKSQTIENSKPTTSSKIEETIKKESTSKPTTTTKPTESKPTHTHEFSAATCTVPQKCSCGETKGEELGHKWTEATCKVAKTCSVCKTTEGNKAAHKYVKGVCSVCEQNDPEFREFIGGKYEIGFFSKNNTYTIITLEAGEVKENVCAIDIIQKEYVLFEKLYEVEYFYYSSEYVIWEGNGKRRPTKAEALEIATKLGKIITVDSEKYYLYTGDGGCDTDVKFNNNTLEFYDGSVVEYSYDGYKTLKLTKITQSFLINLGVPTGAVFTRIN